MKQAASHPGMPSPARAGRRRAVQRSARAVRSAKAVRRAFTLTELLAVITIIALVVSVAVPAFVSMLRSTNQTLAISNFRVAMATARDAAVRSAGLNDSAAVFFYEPGGRTTIATALSVGEFNGRTVWAIDPLTEAIGLPRGWMVNGFAPAGTITAPANEGASPYAWYEERGGERHYDPAIDNWVFPESGFYRTSNNQGRDTTPGDQGGYRQSFMVRFDGTTGGVAFDDRTDGLVLAPDLAIGRGASPWRQRTNPWADPRFRLDGSVEQSVYVRRQLGKAWGTPAYPQQNRELLLGDDCSDTVLTRPVSLLALYDVRELARQIARDGAPMGFRGVNRTTGCFYEPPASANSPDYQFDFAEAVNEAIPEVAQMYTVDRYNGGVVEVTP